MLGTYSIVGADIVLPDRLIEHGVLVVRNGRISRILQVQDNDQQILQELRKEGIPGIQCENAVIVPSLVEFHIHGCGQWGFETIDASSLVKAKTFLESFAVGCFVPTLLWDEEALPRLVSALLDSEIPASIIPGIYLEGPFINAEKKGGIPLEKISAVDESLAQQIIQAGKGKIICMTIAPELSNVERLYRICQESGITIALGHSNAKLSQCTLPESKFILTHLFNAMSGIDHKEGGLANIAFSGLPAAVEINGDGIHVNQSCLRLSMQAIPQDSLILISDAVVSAGLAYGFYDYYGKKVHSSESGVRYAESGILMGSNKLGIDIVNHYMNATGVPLWKAVYAMSLTPRKILGQDADYGSIEEGKMADIFICDKNSENLLCNPKRPEFYFKESIAEVNGRAHTRGGKAQ